MFPQRRRSIIWSHCGLRVQTLSALSRSTSIIPRELQTRARDPLYRLLHYAVCLLRRHWLTSNRLDNGDRWSVAASRCCVNCRFAWSRSRFRCLTRRSLRDWRSWRGNVRRVFLIFYAVIVIVQYKRTSGVLRDRRHIYWTFIIIDRSAGGQ